MTRPPIDREHVLIRLGLAVACGATAVTPWLEDFTTNTERVHSSLAIVAGLLLVLSVLIPHRMPDLAVDPVLTLATLVLLYHGFLFAIEDRYDGAVTVQEALFGFGVGLVALAEMLAALLIRRRRVR
jgi:uncharacterized integral membrane protein